MQAQGFGLSTATITPTEPGAPQTQRRKFCASADAAVRGGFSVLLSSLSSRLCPGNSLLSYLLFVVFKKLLFTLHSYFYYSCRVIELKT